MFPGSHPGLPSKSSVCQILPTFLPGDA
jgi:hypothetical protein